MKVADTDAHVCLGEGEVAVGDTGRLFDNVCKPGPSYARVRHPQYVALIVILLGFLLQWPTLLTLALFPILVVMYVRLAHHEEREVRERFGQDWDAYAAHTPRFIPRLRRPTEGHHGTFQT